MLNEHAALLFSESVISQPLFCAVFSYRAAQLRRTGANSIAGTWSMRFISWASL